MQKVLVDTCFVDKFKEGIHLSEDFERLMCEVGYEPIIHPYVYEKELDVFDFVKEGIEKGVLKVLPYEAFITDDATKKYYEGLFFQIYEDFRNRLIAVNSPKAKKLIELDESADIFQIRMSGSSVGDVHIILLAIFMDIPIVLSEDSDLDIIFRLTRNRIISEKRDLKVYRVQDVIEVIKEKENKTISGKELKTLLRKYR